MHESNNWYWEQQPLQQTITVSTLMIIHPHLDVVVIIDVQGIPKNICNSIKAKIALQRYPICLTDTD